MSLRAGQYPKGSVNFDEYERISYKYPHGLNLHPDSEEHRKLLNLALDAANESYNVISVRFPTWKELDRKLTVYIELDDDEEDVQSKDERKPVSMVVPIMYATREVLLTYQVEAFLQQPIFRYIASRDPDDVLKTILLEGIIEQQSIRQKMALDLYSLWSDWFTYGVGAVATSWIREWGTRTSYEDRISRILGVPYKRRKNRVRKREVLYEGNSLRGIDPYCFLPDPNISVTRIDRMAYCGYCVRDSLHLLLNEERDDPEGTFNVRFVKQMGDRTSYYYGGDDVDSGRYDKTGVAPDTAVSDTSKPTDIIHMFMWIVPEEFGLDGIYPELWYLRIAGDRVIIGAEPVDLDHNMIPICSGSPDADGHTTLPVSILEREYPIQHGMDWLWASHVANVRKSVNNMFLVDPYQVNMEDFVDTRYGLLARMRAAAWGKGVGDALMQIPVSDVTQGNINDIGFLMNVDGRVFTTSQSHGMQERKGERVSSAEAQSTYRAFLNKMGKNARLGSIQAHYDIAKQMAHNTIQFMEEESYVKVVGRYEEQLRKEFNVQGDFLRVSPDSIDARFDVTPQDGSIPSGEYADILERLLSTGLQIPDVVNTVDLARFWKRIARNLGIRNIEDFDKVQFSTRVQDQGTIEERARRGDIAPVAELGGAQ